MGRAAEWLGGLVVRRRGRAAHPASGRLRGDPGPCSASRRMDGRQRADGVARSACGRQGWLMLGGWLNAAACVLKKRIRHLLF